MKRFEKFAIGAFFSISLSLFLILTTIYFQLLNDNYLFGVFEKYSVYEKIAPAISKTIPNDPNLSDEERFTYSTILKNSSPNIIKEAIETNLTQILNFIHGKSNDVIISLPIKEMGLSPTDIKWSLSQNSTQELKNQMNIVHGIALKILILWIIVFMLLISLYLLYGKIAKANILLGGNRLLITNGLWILITGSISKFSINQMVQNLPANAQPSQQIIVILASSLFSEIISGWSVIGFFLLISGIIIFVIDKKTNKNTVPKSSDTISSS